MIIVALIKMFIAILKFFMAPINFPKLQVIDELHVLLSYVSVMAYNLVYLMLPRGVVSTLFIILINVIVARGIYSFVTWLLDKFPMGIR